MQKQDLEWYEILAAVGILIGCFYLYAKFQQWRKKGFRDKED